MEGRRACEGTVAQVTHPADRKLLIAFGDTVHRNDGRHLDGGIAEDAAVQALYDKLMDHPHGMYSPPKGGVGKRFLKMFAAELAKVRNCISNSEQALIFPAAILRRVPGVTRAKAIRKRFNLINHSSRNQEIITIFKRNFAQ